MNCNLASPAKDDPKSEAVGDQIDSGQVNRACGDQRLGMMGAGLKLLDDVACEPAGRLQGEGDQGAAAGEAVGEQSEALVLQVTSNFLIVGGGRRLKVLWYTGIFWGRIVLKREELLHQVNGYSDQFCSIETSLSYNLAC